MNNDRSFKNIISKLSNQVSLETYELDIAFNSLLSGSATNAQIGAFLMGLSINGETAEIIASGATILRSHAIKIKAPKEAIDTVGTGGDGANTLNISSAAAFVVSGAGIPVAKHGNRSLSSKSGAADVLSELGVNLDCPFETVQKSLDELGICFLMAPRHHSAMKYVGPARVELGIRTIFNLLGPLSNPAFVKRQLVGVFDKKWLLPFAEALKKMGSTNAWIVHAKDGLDEVSTTCETYIAQLKDSKIIEFSISPEQFGIKKNTLNSIKGGEPKDNALALKKLLNGSKGPYRDIVLFNSAAAIVSTGHESDFKTAIEMSIHSIDSGEASKKLNSLIKITNSF